VHVRRISAESSAPKPATSVANRLRRSASALGDDRRHGASEFGECLGARGVGVLVRVVDGDAQASAARHLDRSRDRGRELREREATGLVGHEPGQQTAVARERSADALR
jgi:hypothetical protein